MGEAMEKIATVVTAFPKDKAGRSEDLGELARDPACYPNNFNFGTTRPFLAFR